MFHSYWFHVCMFDLWRGDLPNRHEPRTPVPRTPRSPPTGEQMVISHVSILAIIQNYPKLSILGNNKLSLYIYIHHFIVFCWIPWFLNDDLKKKPNSSDQVSLRSQGKVVSPEKEWMDCVAHLWAPKVEHSGTMGGRHRSHHQSPHRHGYDTNLQRFHLFHVPFPFPCRVFRWLLKRPAGSYRSKRSRCPGSRWRVWNLATMSSSRRIKSIPPTLKYIKHPS